MVTGKYNKYNVSLKRLLVFPDIAKDMAKVDHCG